MPAQPRASTTASSIITSLFFIVCTSVVLPGLTAPGALFSSLCEPEAHGYGAVDPVHRRAVQLAHAFAQAGLIQRPDLLEQDDAVPAQAVVARRQLFPVCEVIAAAITVGLCRLPVSFWTMSTGLMPPCSLPTTGLRSA